MLSRRSITSAPCPSLNITTWRTPSPTSPSHYWHTRCRCWCRIDATSNKFATPSTIPSTSHGLGVLDPEPPSGIFLVRRSAVPRLRQRPRATGNSVVARKIWQPTDKRCLLIVVFASRITYQEIKRFVENLGLGGSDGVLSSDGPCCGVQFWLSLPASLSFSSTLRSAGRRCVALRRDHTAEAT